MTFMSLFSYDYPQFWVFIIVYFNFHYSVEASQFSKRSGLTSPRLEVITQKLRQHSLSGAVFLVDGDNVRGKTKFQYTKEKLCHVVTRWAKLENITDRVVVFFDHGSANEAFILNEGQVIVFSGPRASADDVISRDVAWFLENLDRDIVLITEDQELRSRCRKSKDLSRSVSVITSPAFVEVLTYVASTAFQDNNEQSNLSTELQNSPFNSHLLEGNVETAMEGADLNYVELLLREKMTTIKSQIKRSSRKKLMNLKLKLSSLDSQLQTLIKIREAPKNETLITQNSIPIQNGNNNENNNNLRVATGFQTTNYKQIVNTLVNNKPWEPEQTWQRIILAETFRKSLAEYVAKRSVSSDDEALSPSLVESGCKNEFLLSKYVDQFRQSSMLSQDSV